PAEEFVPWRRRCEKTGAAIDGCLSTLTRMLAKMVGRDPKGPWPDGGTRPLARDGMSSSEALGERAAENHAAADASVTRRQGRVLPVVHQQVFGFLLLDDRRGPKTASRAARAGL